MAHRKAAILARLDEGQTFGQIARALGITRSTVAGVSFRFKHPYVPRPWKPPPRGESHWNCKLSDANVIEIRLRRRAGEKVAVLADHFGVGTSIISLIARGQRRADVA